MHWQHKGLLVSGKFFKHLVSWLGFILAQLQLFSYSQCPQRTKNWGLEWACLIFCSTTPKHFLLNFKADGYITLPNGILFDGTHNEMPLRLWCHCNSPFYGIFIPPSLHGSSGPHPQHWPLTALLRRVVLLGFMWQGLRAETETALPEREKNLNIAERHKDCPASSDQASWSSCSPRCCHPLGSSCCCFSEPILAPSHRMLLMPELSNQLCSSCEHGSALLQIATVLPATWKTATDSRQSLAFAWHNLGFAELLLFTESSGTCQAQGRWKILQGSENSKAGVPEQGRWRSALLPQQKQNPLILPKHTVLFFWRLNEQ